MDKTNRDNSRKSRKINRFPSTQDDKEERSDRNQPKILSGSIRLPQVFGYSGLHKDMSRVSYNFKYSVSEIAVERNMDKMEPNDTLFLNVIRRPRVYKKFEGDGMLSRTPTSEVPGVPDKTRTEVGGQKRERTSKSCPKPVNLEMPIPRQLSNLLQEDFKPQGLVRGKSGSQSMFEIGFKHVSFDELSELNSPAQAYAGLDHTIGQDQDWQKQISALNELRSILKFNPNIVEDSTLTLLIFKKVSSLVIGSKLTVTKNALLALYEGISKLGATLSKLAMTFIQCLFGKLSDCSSVLYADLEKTIDQLFEHCPPAKLLLILANNSDYKSVMVKLQVVKGVTKSIDKLQKDIFLVKDYEKVIKLLAVYSKDYHEELRNSTKTCIRLLSSMSEQPSLVLKAIQQSSAKIVVHQKQGQADISNREEGGSRRMDRKVGLQLKRLATNKLSNLNRTEEFGKEGPPVSIPLRNNKQMCPKLEDEADDSLALKALPLMQMKKKHPQLTKVYPELEVFDELISDMQKEDWQGKIEALKLGATLCVEHEAKFVRSVYLVKFLDAIMRLFSDPNQKIQIECLQSLKTDLRSPFKNLPERQLSMLVEHLFKLQGSNNTTVKQLAACCFINLREHPDKKILKTVVNRQYVNLSIKAKANFAKFLADNASRIDEATMGLLQPVLVFNVLNANSELKRLNELLFKELLNSYGEKLFAHFDERCAEAVRGLAGNSSPPQTLNFQQPAERPEMEEAK